MEISRDLHYIECMLEQIASYDINYKNRTQNKYRAIQAHESCHRTNVSIDTDFAKKKKANASDKQVPLGAKYEAKYFIIYMYRNCARSRLKEIRNCRI